VRLVRTGPQAFPKSGDGHPLFAAPMGVIQGNYIASIWAVFTVLSQVNGISEKCLRGGLTG
jgi:hypothetical protein